MFAIPCRWRYNANRHEGRSILHFVIEKCEWHRWYRKWDSNPHAVMASAFEADMSTYSIISAYKRGSMLTITPMPGTTCTDHVLNLYWCGTRDLNPYAHKDTTTSTLPVCRFQQFRIKYQLVEYSFVTFHRNIGLATQYSYLRISLLNQRFHQANSFKR